METLLAPARGNRRSTGRQQPELNAQTPAFQFSSTVELAHSKGGHMWGRFKMERPNGSTFDVAIPTVVLESFDEGSVGNIEKTVE
uniref:Protein TAG-307 n=1 Tax=Haemonchus contortus TaxID=6289 RepID=W6NED0_HAECO